MEQWGNTKKTLEVLKMTKLWSVTVNDWGWDQPKTIYAPSREEAERAAARFECSDPVEYAGNFSDRNAAVLLAPYEVVCSPDVRCRKWWWDLWKAGKAPWRYDMSEKAERMRQPGADGRTEAWILDAAKDM